MERFDDENEKNIYVIKRKLTTYKMLSGEEHWTLNIGRFVLSISLTQEDFWRVTNNLGNRAAVRDTKIIDFEKLNIHLYEDYRKDEPSFRRYVNLTHDPRFKDYLPIQYDVIETPTGGRINQSDGKHIPLLQLMELIRLLYRLSNLSAFT